MKDAVGRYPRIVLLGGGSEIGQAIVRELVRRTGRSTVVLSARRPEDVDVRGLADRDLPVERLRFDLLDPQTHAAPFVGADDVDLVILAAAVLGDQATAEHDPATAARVAQVNYSGAVSVLTHALTRMRAQGHGTIVVISSIAAVRPRRSNFLYGSSKAGLDAFARGMQLAAAEHGVRVLIVRPGFVKTRMTQGLKPLPLAVSAQEVAVAVADGLRDGREIVWAPAAMRLVALALRVLPRPLLRLL